MKLWMILILVFTIECFATNDVKAPKLTFIGKRIIKIGKVKEGEVIEQKVFFTNTGNYPLIIKDIRKSCNCAKAIVEDPRTLPKDTNYISITVNTKGKIGINVVDIVLTTNTQQKEYITKLIMDIKK